MNLQDAITLGLLVAALVFLGCRVIRKRRCCDAGTCGPRQNEHLKSGEGSQIPAPMEV